MKKQYNSLRMPAPGGRLSVAIALALLAVCLPGSRVQAGGLYLFDRGARAQGRGGAWVAGADDPGALWYNPAGLFYSKNQLVADASLPILLADVTRLLPSGEYAPTVKAKPTPIPIPTLAFSHMVGKRMNFGAGFITPNVLLMNYEGSVGPERDPNPVRYSLLELKGTVLTNLTAGMAWEVFDGLVIGADFMTSLGYMRAKLALSACDAVICSFPEQKDFDAYATAKMFPTYGFTGVFGAIVDMDILKLGASLMLPYTLRGRGKAEIEMPTHPIFEDAYQSGDDAKLAIKFPTIVRVGSELRLNWLRLEGAFVWEQWSRQKDISIDVGEGVAIKNVTGLGDYEIGDIKIQRNMNDVWSLRGGFEATFPRSWVGKLDFGMRGGLAYETGAFSSKSMSPFTIDSDKTILSGGFTIGLAKWLRFDTVGGLIFMQNMNVTDSEIRQPQAIRPPLETFPTVIGNGRYEMASFFLGGGFRVQTDLKSGWR